jgi:prepilin-type N-terminal cleavage/methylation domain-containing protein
MLNKLFHNNNRGFTLIEILVVVAILGTLAAIVIPNILHLRSEGRVDAANTELYDTQLAILSSMIEYEVVELTPGTVGPNSVDVSTATGNVDTIAEIDAPAYIDGVLQAIYIIDEEGHIADATTVGLLNSKWNGLSFVPNTGWIE